MKRTIVTMPGDGIGAVVLPESLRVLDAAGFQADYVHADIGWEFWMKEGNALPQRTVDLIARHRVALFGAITSKPKDEADAELAPELRGKGLVYSSPIVGLRQKFNLDVSIRPCQTIAGNPLNFIRRDGDGVTEPKVNAVIFRQNTEGLYAGIEWTDPPEPVRQGLAAHPKWKVFKDVPPADLAVSTRIVTRPAARRIAEEAFAYARRHGYRKVTVCEKPNVLRETSGMMIEEARKVASDHPEIRFDYTNIDAQLMWLTKSPEDYQVVVCENMFGDIVSDAFAGLVGGLGFAASANLGKDCAVFEPTHGSAPKYAELPVSIVNPIAMVMSAVMMLEHLGEAAIAKKVRGAVERVVAEGKVRSYDMMRLPGGSDALKRGAASTAQMTDALIAAL